MKYSVSILFLALLSLVGCIGDDVIMDEVDETLRITNAIETLAKGDTYQLDLRYTNNIGQEVMVEAAWESSDPSVLTVDENGTLTGVEFGDATVTSTVELPDATFLTASVSISVSEETSEPPMTNMSRSGTITTTSSYLLTGNFEISSTDTGILIEIAEDYQASEALPGLYVYLGNNPNSIANALELQAVQVFEGSHSYTVPGVDISDYDYLLYWCKPFGVKVGDGKIN